MNIASSPSNIDKVETLAKAITVKYDLSDDLYPNILISLTEAISNAIIHGNHSDASKYVEVKVRQSEKGITIRVCDQGNGFNYRSLPDPTAPENIGELGGRGVFMMKELTDKCVFLDEGRTVEMYFQI